MESALELKNVSKSYKDFKLDNINLSVPKGSIMGFIGENGAGKTTVIKTILNIVERENGIINIFNKDNIKCEREVKEKIGVVLDDSFFYEGLNAKDIQRVMSKMYLKWDNKIYEDYIKRFDLPFSKPIKEYSKGMKMKQVLATALAHSPDLLILDEPLNGLDPIIRNEILDIFLEFIQDENHSILISSHITSDLEKIADYITFIHQGKIIESKSKIDFLNEYGLLKCGESDFDKIEKKDILRYKKNSFGYEIMIKNKKDAEINYPEFVTDSMSLDDIMYYYIRGNTLDGITY